IPIGRRANSSSSVISLSPLSRWENNTYHDKYQETADKEASIDKLHECKKGRTEYSPASVVLRGITQSDPVAAPHPLTVHRSCVAIRAASAPAVATFLLPARAEQNQ